MAVTITAGTPPQQITVETGAQLKSLGSQTIMLSGSEQTVCSQPGGTPSQITGYIDLSKLASGDTVVVKFYVKIKENGAWGACYEDSYSGKLSLPVVHVAKRPENHGLMITVKQTTGPHKQIDYEFFEES